ncbi:MAG TPA: uroporphyrinogen decarboxylase family protein [Planctomycetota bacterium]|nr:uroporphyrinogen decarboxylase family protein [Planctomycetota bacterium]
MPEVFISYRQLDDEQRLRVRAFAERLVACGIEVILDQFYLDDHPEGPPEGWPKWSSDRATETQRVIIIGTEAWFRCFDGKQPPGTGLGAACEAQDLRQRIYDHAGVNEDIRVVLFDDADAGHISFKLKGWHWLHAERDFDSIVRWLGGTAPAAPPVATRDDFEAIKERLDPKTPGRYPADWDEWAKAAPDFPHILCLGRRENGFFGWLRELMGLEGLLFAYLEQPDLIHEICRYQVTYLQTLYERALRDVEFDFVFMWEDMAFKNGPLISPDFVRTFMLPYYREMIDFYRQMGAKLILQDSDGNMTKLIPLFIEAGLDGMLPFEVAAGMDVVKTREAFPKLRILGGIDKRALYGTKADIDRELKARLPAMFRSGGYIPTLDHHAPPEVSYGNFRYYLRRCREIYDTTR